MDSWEWEIINRVTGKKKGWQRHTRNKCTYPWQLQESDHVAVCTRDSGHYSQKEMGLGAGSQGRPTRAMLVRLEYGLLGFSC